MCYRSDSLYMSVYYPLVNIRPAAWDVLLDDFQLLYYKTVPGFEIDKVCQLRVTFNVILASFVDGINFML